MPRVSRAFTAIFARIVILSTAKPSSRKNPFRLAISMGRMLTPGPVEPIFISSAVARIVLANHAADSAKQRAESSGKTLPGINGVLDYTMDSTLLFCDVRSTETFRAVAHEYQRLGSGIGDLVVIFSIKKDDLIFLDDPLLAFDSLDRRLSLQNQKSFR